MSELPITDEEILKYAKTDYSTMRLIKEAKQNEAWRLQKEREKQESRKRDDERALKFVGATVESTEIVQYRDGQYSDYEPTVIKLFTNKGVFIVNDPSFDTSVETMKEEKEE